MTNKKKPEWGNGPTIERIAFNPEQAVLACCTVNASAINVRFEGSTECNIGGGPQANACASNFGGKANCSFTGWGLLSNNTAQLS